MRKATWIVGVVALWSFVAVGGGKPEARAWEQSRGQAKKAAKADAKADKKADKRDDKRDDKKDDKKDDRADHRRDEGAVVAVDRDGHVRVIRDYARGGSLPPGLAKRQALPPGLREQLRERGALPPGLQKRLVVVPASLSRRLPPVPVYYRRYFAGDDLLVIDTRTNLIVAIVRDIWG